jgi:hypothetical protein
MSIPITMQCLHCSEISSNNGSDLYCDKHMTPEYRRYKGYSTQGEGFALFMLIFGILTLPLGIGVVFIILGFIGLQKKH